MTVHRLGDPARHFWLTRSVTRVMDVSIADAIADGCLTQPDFARMVTRCRGCGQVGACERWLGAQTALTDDPPPGCLNADILRHLRQRRRA